MNEVQARSRSMPDPGMGGDTRMAPPGLAAGFRSGIQHGWGESTRRSPTITGAAEAAAAHRARLSEGMVGHTIVVAAGFAPVRSNDCLYDFRPSSDFYWLTGCDAQGAVLLMRPAPGGHVARLYLHPPARPGDADFFSDAVHGELWAGPSPSVEEWGAALLIDVAPISELARALCSAPQALRAGAPTDVALPWAMPLDGALATVLDELRMRKDDWELGQLARAVDSTVAGFAEVVRELPEAVGGRGERWLQATFDRHARSHGNGPGYLSIVASGVHAPTLHWVRCDGPVDRDDLLLLDMGVEEKSFYTADVTRTFPVSGHFSSTQRAVHDLVEQAHRAGLDAVRPGARFGDFHAAVMEVLARGLHDWELLPVSVDEALSPSGQHHRRYLVCGVGHHLGLDLHDCADSTYAAYQGGTLDAGMVLTVEPGLYFHAHDLTLPPELRGLGVRIEDDVEVTATGTRILSARLPIDATGIEEWMRTVMSPAGTSALATDQSRSIRPSAPQPQ